MRLEWRKPEGMAGLGFVNFLLRLVTLGIHNFWGKSEVRRRLWTGIRINDEPLTYTGTGWELFRGFLLSILCFLLPFFVLLVIAQIMAAKQPLIGGLLILAIYIPFFMLIFVAFYSANRYRLSRTEWRGIRGSLEGSAWSYAWACLWTGLLNSVTLGWMTPWRATYLQKKLVDNMRFGNRPLSFDATSGPLYGPFALAWIVGIAALIVAAVLAWPLMKEFFEFAQKMEANKGTGRQPNPAEMQRFGIIYFQLIGVFLLAQLVGWLASTWYAARSYNHFANHTHFEGATFKGNISAGGLIWQAISNLLIVLFTFGILTPVALARILGYRIRNTSLDGNIPVADVIQSGSTPNTSGEGLAQLFDIDVF